MLRNSIRIIADIQHSELEAANSLGTRQEPKASNETFVHAL